MKHINPINANFSHITKRYENTFNVVFVTSDGIELSTICKWITNSKDVNYYVSYNNGYVVGLNNPHKYFISELERMKAVDAVFKKLKNIPSHD